jgi:cytochrome c oxidase assembly factor 5
MPRHTHNNPPKNKKQDERRSVVECADTKPEECESLRYALFACKRGQVDARSRIQGNKGY